MTVLTEVLLEWADKAYAMEKKHLDQIQKYTGSKYYTKVAVLNIPDIYGYYDKGLLKILDERIKL